MFAFINSCFFVFHTIFILFILIGWKYAVTRKYHLISVSLTAFSWFVLGIWHGWGYCFLTDLQWRIRGKLGAIDVSESYTHCLLCKLTGINFSQHFADWLTASAFFIFFGLSIALNLKDWKSKNKNSENPLAASLQ